MSNCPFCNSGLPAKAGDKHLILTETPDNDGHGHHFHGAVEDKAFVKHILQEADAFLKAGAFSHQNVRGRLSDEIIFHNRQRIGDMLMFTCGVRDFKAAFPDVKTNVISIAPHIWDNNPILDRTIKERYSDDLKARAAAAINPKTGKAGMHVIDYLTPADYPEHTNVVKIGPGWLTDSSNRLDWHFANAFRASIEQALGIHIPQGLSRPDVWLTEEEFNAPRVDPRPYWVLCGAGEKSWGCKIFPWERWQTVIDQNPDILFYQVGTSEDNHPRLKGANVVDWIGKTQDRNTGIRDLFKLVLNAEGTISLVSFLMHAGAAFFKPGVVIAGAREPVSFTRYYGHQYLSTEGTLPCASVKACWCCDSGPKTRCEKMSRTEQTDRVPECVVMIEPEDVTRALRSYYRGGRLNMKTPLAKPDRKHVNLVKTAVNVWADPAAAEQRYGYTWGGASITSEDWEFIHGVIVRNKIKTVLEFGSGLSTLLLSELCEVLSFETIEKYRDIVKAKKPSLNVQIWDGKDVTIVGDFDMAFVDGPPGGANREHSTRLGAQHAKFVLVHDAGRPTEKEWQDKYLACKGFMGPIKGGKRCHLWVREGTEIPQSEDSPGTGLPQLIAAAPAPAPTMPTLIGETPAPATCAQKTGLSVKMLSTAQGWGGAQRSVTTMMRMLVEQGHRVEFITLGHEKVTSREYAAWLKDHPAIKVTEGYSTVSEPCDVMVMYADDRIWGFNDPKYVEAFSNLRAEQKIMVLNYRRGKVGEELWTKAWDKYMFLNSEQERELLKVLPGVTTKVLAPCTDLTPFFAVQAKYDGGLRAVRHHSQGDVKFYGQTRDEGEIAAQKKRTFDEILAALKRPDLTINMMPGPSFVSAAPPRFVKQPRTADAATVAAFLSTGNLFWYSLAPGYGDMGPRVVMEAMAVGIPCLVDTWGGAVDRVGGAGSTESGWAVDKKTQIEVLLGVTEAELKKKGTAARERARQEFVPQRWIDEIVGCVAATC